MRALGIDYGQRRIGLALSDATGMLARPWKVIARVGNISQAATTIADEIGGLAADEAVDVIVIGHPRRLSGEPNEQTAVVEKLAEQLRRLVATPVVLQDERLSSREAESLLARREKDWRKRKVQLDATAAAVILQDYLDSAAGEQREFHTHFREPHNKPGASRARPPERSGARGPRERRRWGGRRGEAPRSDFDPEDGDE
jgi:putative Holliday junction resolvase